MQSDFQDPYNQIDFRVYIESLSNKWRFIALITALFTILALLISALLPNVYEVSAVIRPGILKIIEGEKSDKNEIIYIDSVQNLQALIKIGTFDDTIIQKLKDSGEPDIPTKIRYKLDLPKDSSSLKITYETSKIQFGKRLLNILIDQIGLSYGETVNYHIKQFDLQIDNALTHLNELKSQKDSLKSSVANYNQLITELNSGLSSVNDNTEKLSVDQARFIGKKNDENNVLSSLLYTTTIQQNMSLKNDYISQIEGYQKEIGKINLLIVGIDANITLEENKVRKLKFQKDNVRNVQIIQKPYSSRNRVKPKIALNVAVGMMLGLTISILVVILGIFKNDVINKRYMNSNEAKRLPADE